MKASRILAPVWLIPWLAFSAPASGADAPAKKLPLPGELFSGQGHNMWQGFFRAPELVEFVKQRCRR